MSSWVSRRDGVYTLKEGESCGGSGCGIFYGGGFMGGVGGVSSRDGVYMLKDCESCGGSGMGLWVEWAS